MPRKNRISNPALKRWHWQPWEIALLGQARDRILAELLGRSIKAVVAKRIELGIPPG